MINDVCWHTYAFQLMSGRKVFDNFRSFSQAHDQTWIGKTTSLNLYSNDLSASSEASELVDGQPLSTAQAGSHNEDIVMDVMDSLIHVSQRKSLCLWLG
jgi:hypothetical protein